MSDWPSDITVWRYIREQGVVTQGDVAAWARDVFAPKASHRTAIQHMVASLRRLSNDGFVWYARGKTDSRVFEYKVIEE